jgi:hypothetical protein
LHRHWKVEVAALALVLLVAGGWALHWFLTADERLEKSAVERLNHIPRRLLDQHKLRGWAEGDDYPSLGQPQPQLWHLGNGAWVAEYCRWNDLKWDYRRTGSKVFPYEATVAVQVRRYVSIPYASEESAAKSLKLDPAHDVTWGYDTPYEERVKAMRLWEDRKIFFEVETSAEDLKWEKRSFPDKPSSYGIARLPILAAELLFNTKHEYGYPPSFYEEWEIKATHVFWDWTEYDKWKQTWDKKGTGTTP